MGRGFAAGAGEGEALGVAGVEGGEGGFEVGEVGLDGEWRGR